MKLIYLFLEILLIIARKKIRLFFWKLLMSVKVEKLLNNQSELIREYRSVSKQNRNDEINYRSMDNQLSKTQSQKEEEDELMPLLILDDKYDLFITRKKCSDIYQALIEDNISLKRGISQLSQEQKSVPQLFNTSFNNIEIGIRDSSKTETVPSSQLGVKCKCTKSKCQKNYCQCYKNGQVCSEACGCVDCSNIETDFAALHSKSGGKGGCKCKRSHCLKNYCQCHNAGKKCSQECACLQCSNMADDSLSLTEQFQGQKARKKIKTQASCMMNLPQNIQNISQQANCNLFQTLAD